MMNYIAKGIKETQIVLASLGDEVTNIGNNTKSEGIGMGEGLLVAGLVITFILFMVQQRDLAKKVGGAVVGGYVLLFKLDVVISTLKKIVGLG